MTTIIFSNQTSLTDILTAIGTVGAVLFSLFYAFYKDWWQPKNNKARFDVSLDPIYSFSVDCDWEGIMDERYEDIFTSADIRFRVEHTGGKPAKNIEVFVSKIWTLEGSAKKVWPHFLPANLLWSGKRKEQLIRADFAQGTVRFCDIGVYCDNKDGGGWVLNVATNNVGDPQIEKFSNVIPTGVYEFEILITGENTEPVINRFSIEIDGGWAPDEETMFSEHFKIKKI
ncbi:MAG: hypothetical protein WC791_00530 [Candidatus Paceibacterota bacterium]|jgi:hypothetical protein